MENIKNIITFCSCKPSQKNNIEAHENLLTHEKSVEVPNELQDTISKDRKVNKLWQKLFNIRLNLKTRLFKRKRSIHE